MRSVVAWILVSVVAMILIVWIVDLSQTVQGCVASSRSQHPQQTELSALLGWHTDCLGAFVKEKEAAITALATVLLTIVTAGLVIVTGMQFKTSRAQLRAYVFVESAVTANVVDGTGPPEAHVVIKNFGQTPAYEVLHMGGLAVYEFPPPPMVKLTATDEDFVTGPTTNMALAPGANYLSTTPLKIPVLPPHFRKGIIAGNLAAYVYGEIRYKDVFQRKQWTKYRLMLGGPVGVRGGHLVGSAEGNEAT